MLQLLTKLFGKKFVQNIMGTRTNVQLLKTVRNNPFTQSFSKQALKDNPGMLSEAEAVMQRYAGHALANKNLKESTQFMKNLRTLDEVKNPPKAQVYEFATKKEMPKKVKEGIEKVRGGDPDTLQGSMQSMMSLIDEMQGITPTMRVAKNRQELADFIRKMRGKKFTKQEIDMVKNYADKYSMNLAKEKLAPAISKTKQWGGSGKAQINLTEEHLDDLATWNKDQYLEYNTVGQTNYKIREGMLDDLRAQGLGDDIIEAVDDELYQLSHNRTGGPFGGTTTSSHPANWVKRAGEEIEEITGLRFDTKFYENFGNEVLSKYKGKPEFASGGIARVGMLVGGAAGKAFLEFIEKLFIKASNDIRLGRGKWKGLDQKQKMVQHDNLTKMVTQWQKTKQLPEGAEQYFGVDAKKAFAAAEAKATGKLSSKAEVEAQRQEQIMEEAYEEIRGGSGFTGDDLKYDADILAESLATVQGKDYAALGADEVSKLYNQAYKRVSQDFLKRREARKALKDVEEKIELQMFDPKDRLPNASGGIAGQLHLNQGGRARFANGSPLVDARMQNTYAENIAANEAQKTENLKTRAISALGDATGYTQHNINNQLLRNALADKQINEAQYKRMGGYDVAQQMPDIFGVFGKPAGVAAASTGYNIIKSLAGLINPDDPNAQYGDIGRVASILENTRGSTGLSPENLALYNQIISGQTSAPATQSTSARENYAQYKARMLESLRKSHAGQEYAMTDLTPTGGYSGTSRELPIETYFNYMLADPWAHGFNPQTGIQFGTDDQGQFTNQSQFKQEMADYRTANPDYPYSHPLAKGGLAKILGV